MYDVKFLNFLTKNIIKFEIVKGEISDAVAYNK